MAKPSVLISIDTMIETEDRTFGRDFMQCLLREDARLTPELVSETERFTEPFVDLDHFMDKWWAMPVKSYVDGRLQGERFGGPLWKRKSSLASRGVIDHGLLNIRNQRTPSGLWFECRWANDVSFDHLFEAWVRLSHPDMGMLHVFTDIERASLHTSAGTSFSVGSFGGPAKPGLPNIGWAMAYGKERAAEVDIERIAAAGFPVREVDGTIIVQVTEKLSDVIDDFPTFSKRRAELKRLFRLGLFWIEDEPVAA